MIPAHLSQVWHLIKLGSFDRWLSTLKSSEEAKGTSPDTDVVKWTFKDGTVQEIKQEEHSVRRLGSPSRHARQNIRPCPLTPRTADAQPLHYLQHHHFAARPYLHLVRQHHPLLRGH